MCLLKEVSVIVARRMLFKRNTFRCQFPQCKKKGNEHRTMSATKFTSDGAQTKKHLENCYAPHLLEVDYIKDLLFFFSSAHSPLHESIFYEFSHPCCPSQGIFPPPAVSFRGQDVGREKIS